MGPGTEPLPLDRLRQALAEHRHTLVEGAESFRKAAVAAILHADRDGAELLFIRRAQHHGDPWSGHMAFPGGRVDPGDATPFEAALRETREELGLDLRARARLLGRLSQVRTVARGRPLRMVIEPFVFELDGRPELIPNHEVEEAVWVPLAFLAEPSNRSRMMWTRGGLPVPLPCYRYGGRLIWGLTLRMVDELLSLARS
jgi:8-oxo-dGTP pyrophosphatase MutT (NUDIX family)